MNVKKKLVCVFFFLLVLSFGYTSQVNVEAKATNKAMKFLKGTWVTAGQSNSVKMIFTKKYVIAYDLWNSDYTKVKNPKKKGKYLGKAKIISTKKKGKKWTIKVKSGNGVNYYKGCGNTLICWFKSNGEWTMSGSSSLNRYSKKVYK